MSTKNIPLGQIKTMEVLYPSLLAIKEAVKNGILVNWQNGLYYVKQTFDGDFVVKCTNTPMQELLTENFNLNDFFTEVQKP